MHFKKLKKSVVSATTSSNSTSKKTKKVVHKNRYSTFNNSSDESFPQSSLRAAQKKVEQSSSSSNQQLLSAKQMVSINAVQQQLKGPGSKQKQHVAAEKTKETKVELKMSSQQQHQSTTKTVIHKRAFVAGKSNKRSRLRRAFGRGWKRARKIFRTVFCCQPWSSSSSSSAAATSSSSSSSSTWCRKNCFAYVRKYNSPTRTDDEDDIDAAFERYKRQMLTADGNRSGNAPTGSSPASYDELTPSQKSTIKKLNKNKFWNWNDSVKSTSDKFLDCLELDDISCGEASLRKKFTTIARRKQITAFCEDRAILGEIEIGSAPGSAAGSVFNA